MTTYITLFRGINVGGKNIVKMAALKAMFESLGFQKVKTYIQSGNVLFQAENPEKSNETNDAEAFEKTLTNKVETKFKDAFGFESKVIMRSENEISRIIEDIPFSSEEVAEAELANADVEHLYVYLFSGPVCKDDIEKLCEKYNGPDLIQIHGREMYLLCHQSIRDSKLAILLGKVKTPVTVRNWKTMNKLNILTKEL